MRIRFKPRFYKKYEIDYWLCVSAIFALVIDIIRVRVGVLKLGKFSLYIDKLAFLFYNNNN